jgi:hypothetical protein
MARPFPLYDVPRYDVPKFDVPQSLFRFSMSRIPPFPLILWYQFLPCC